MEITCTHCKTKLNIPDDKIPKDQTVRINCPKCKNKITIKEQALSLQGAQAEKHTDESVKTGSDAAKKENQEVTTSNTEDLSDSEALEFYEEDVKLALVMVDVEVQEKTARSLEDLEYKCIIAPDTRDALGKLRFHHFDVVLLSDGFDGLDFASSPIINQMNHMSMSTRRRIFLALMSDKFRTMDETRAYAMSANIVINSNDMDKLTQILKKGISEYKKFYKVYMDTLVEVGKA